MGLDDRFHRHWCGDGRIQTMNVYAARLEARATSESGHLKTTVTHYASRDDRFRYK
jgi:hypothetical protein